MNTEANTMFTSGKWALCCPSCDCTDVQIGNASYFKQKDDSQASDYYRLDEKEGVVAMVLDDPTRRVEGRLLIIDCFGTCGHFFNVMFQCHEGTTEMCEVSTGKIMHVGSRMAPAVAPKNKLPSLAPVAISPAMWLRFLHEMHTENDVTYSTLMTAIPLQSRQRHMVFCFPERSVSTAAYLGNPSVQAHIVRKLDRILGGSWTMEVLTSDVLDG